MLEIIPAGRLGGSPEEVAAVVAFLASDGALRNRRNIHVNGGMYMG